MPNPTEEMIEAVALAMQRVRDEIGATEQQRIAFAYAEAAMREAITAWNTRLDPERERLRSLLEDARTAIEAATAAFVFGEPTQSFLYETHEKIAATLNSEVSHGRE